MSENNRHNEAIEGRSESLQDVGELNSHIRASFEDVPKTDAVLSNFKTDIQAKEVVIVVEDATEKDKVPAFDVKQLDHFIYGHYGQQIHPPKTTWVMFEGKGGAALPPDATPLDYDPQSRNGFVRLTLSIVLLMLLITAAFVILVLSIDDFKIFFRTKGMFLALPAMIIMILMSYSIACSSCTRLFPCNIVILVIALICMSTICAWITSRWSTRIVVYALISTCIVVFICVLLAFSGFDFTAYMLYIVVIAAAFGAISLVVFIGMLITGTYLKILHLVILIVGTLINVIILTVELQMILGGGAVELGESDYALGAFLLYTSIVDIFIKLVQILGILDSL